MSYKSAHFLSGILVFALLALTACGSDTTAEAPAPVPAPEVQSYPGLAPIAPPKPMFEEKPVLQSPETQIWKPGYWSWNGSEYSWIPGEVVPRPAPTAAWFPDHWMWHTYGWAFVPGYWE